MRVAGLLLLCAGCFNPNLGEGGFPCGSDGTCPADFSCLVSTCWPAKTAEECAGVATISGGTSICPDRTLTLSASAGARYAWSTGATSSSIDVSAPGSYRVVVDGCEAAPVVVTQAVLQLPPVVTVEGGGTSFCPGTRDAITLTSDEQPSYLWSNGATTRSITVTEPGSYTVTSQGCFTSNAVDIKPPITPVVTAVCEGNYYTLTAPAASSYSWSNGAVSQSIAPATAGDYTVTVDGCLTSPAFTVAASELPPVVFDFTGALQTFVVPTCPTSLTISAWGAQGGGANVTTPTTRIGGLGRGIRATFTVTPGETLNVLVGGEGSTATGVFCDGALHGGGGGGSFVWRPTAVEEPMIAAGGGGGGGSSKNTYTLECADYFGSTGNSATATGLSMPGKHANGTQYAGAAVENGAGGNGGGSAVGSGFPGGGGGGWKGAGTLGGGIAGSAGPGAGGDFAAKSRNNGSNGGYGGGSPGNCSGGGGGGYSGGGGGEGVYDTVNSRLQLCGGGGGGSFAFGTTASTPSPSTRSGHGQVIISW